MGGSTGGGTQVIQPTPPPQPSTADAIKEYVNSLPAILQAQLDIAPKEIEQQLALLQEYGLPLAQAFQGIQQELNPETFAIQEELAAKARKGIEEGAPDVVEDKFRREFRANLGTNIGSPIGAESTARSLAELDELYRQQSQNLALTLAGRQPLAAPQVPQFTNQVGQFSPGQALNFQAQNYNTFANASRPLLGRQAGRRTFGQGFGDITGGLGNLFSFTKEF